ncbi:hypothetical protein TOPB45_0745 [Thermodesulfobacterium geofontis OPF15]|jgi:hypothetical protein|uniref:HEAT repeat domain-containing protein n=1 Tax=Thermodesulfobacterium geofontis (strain OPF15) TaxID=795359 RepID=F8C579_THEGP|nr:HEAT repeat domain-containing protein [Thermodesulfobacterium geofontis]AEH22846.1 hypothetical protein TOPB45_0745 [Thermodesulfobacterium geofontis OPF15]
MKWFCPFCWQKVEEDTQVCPNCRKDLTKFSTLDFDEKLILGLNSPITQNRMFVIEVLGKRKCEKAVPKLCRMLLEERDIFELLEIAKALFKIGTSEALDCLKKAKIKLKKNSTFQKYLEKVLNLES